MFGKSMEGLRIQLELREEKILHANINIYLKSRAEWIR